MDLVSIIIPTYKGSHALSRAINSALNQTYENIEVIVVDDNMPNSEERSETEKVMTCFENNEKLLYLKHEKNRNGAAARNTGIANAKGDYIAFLDDDDYYLPERIERSINYLKKHSGLVGVYVGVDVVDQEGNVRLRVRPECDLNVSDLLQEEMIIGTGSNIFIKSEIVQRIRGFDETFIRRQDIEFMIRVCHEGRIGHLSDLLIVKSTNGTLNHPTYDKMKTVINQFSEKFSDDIENLGAKKPNYYAMQYRTLFDIALFEHNNEEIMESMELIKTYSKLTLKEKLRAFIYIYRIKDNYIYTAMLRILKKITRRVI